MIGCYRHLTPTESSYDIVLKKIINPEGLNVYKEKNIFNPNFVGVQQSNLNSMQFSSSLEHSQNK